MSIIQQIRDKAAWLVFGLIALSLVGFLLMDAFVGRGRFFGGSSNTVGSVDGEKLDYVKFQKLVAEREDQYKSQGYPINDVMQQNIRDGVWKEFEEDVVMTKVYNQLGLEVSDKELSDMLVGANAIPEIRRSFTDQQTGVFDAQAAATTINQLRTIYKSNRRTDKNFEQAQRFFEEGIPQIIKGRLREKYLALLSNSIYIPKWMAEKMNSDNSQVSSIDYVNTPYGTVPDSSIKVSDDEIKEYVDKHKDQYKQEESRSVAYVIFNAAPTSTDSAAVLQQLMSLKNEFASSTDPAAFIARSGSDVQYFDGYVYKSKMQVPHKDSIMALPKGAIYGPYIDANTYVLAKMIDEKSMPDSVKARHILISMVDQKGQPTLDDSTAKNRIDSIKTLIEKGMRFDSAALKFSDDGSKLKGGDLGYFSQGQMVKEFNDFCFSGKTGDKKIVKTQFGYHYIEITDQKGFEPAYKIAYLAKRIDASPETDQNASGLANQFAGESRNQKAFDENVQKKKLQKLLGMDILPTDVSIQGLGANRQLVRWVYDAELGDVSEPYNVGDKYVVAMVTEINQKGTMSAAKARPTVEPILRNQKKAEQIIKKIGAAASLEAVAGATGQQVQKSDSLSFASPYIPNVGQEAKVIGSAFNKQLVGKPASYPIPGNGGVFVIKVENISARPNFNADIEQIRRAQLQVQQNMIQRSATEELKNIATIKDYRSKFF
jgi:peptidyl-prolyl cis-trans isomerase D